VHEKGNKVRHLPLHPGTVELIAEYVEATGQGKAPRAPLFRPLKNNHSGKLEKAMTTDGVYKMVMSYAKEIGLIIEGFGAHSLRATAVTNALDHEADIAKVQEWLGHTNIATTRLYDRCKMRAEDSERLR
jgi:integrase